MWEDPIVAEVHRTREKLAAQCGYDVKAFFAELRRRQAELGGRLVPQKARGDESFGERFAQFKGAAADLPDDLANQHDHYRLGTPKR